MCSKLAALQGCLCHQDPGSEVLGNDRATPPCSVEATLAHHVAALLKAVLVTRNVREHCDMNALNGHPISVTVGADMVEVLGKRVQQNKAQNNDTGVTGHMDGGGQ